MAHKVGRVVERVLEASEGRHRSVSRTTVLLSDGTVQVSDDAVNETEDETCPTFVMKPARVSFNLGGGRQLSLEQCCSALTEDVSRAVKSAFANIAPEEGSTAPTSDLRGICSEALECEITADATMQLLRAMSLHTKGSRLELGTLLAYWPGVEAYLGLIRKRGELPDSSTPTVAAQIPFALSSTAGGAKCLAQMAKEAQLLPTYQPQGEGVPLMSQLEKDVLREINTARTQPHIYARIMEAGRAHCSGAVCRSSAWGEAAGVLKTMRPMAPIKEVPLGLCLAAKEHAADQGATGQVGHAGSDGSLPSERCCRFGIWQSALGENVVYGSEDARDIVASMIADEGAPGRGQRENVFGNWSVAGIATAKHPKSGTTCIVDFAGGYSARREDAKQMRAKQAAQQAASGSDGTSAEAKAKKIAQHNAQAAPPRSKIKVYGRDNCGQCRTMHDALNAASIPFLKLDIDRDRSFFPVMTHCGYRGGRFGLPVVVVPAKNTAHWDVCDPFRLVAELGAALDTEDRLSRGGRGDSTAGQGEVVKLFIDSESQACASLCRLLDDFSVNYATHNLSEDWSCLRAMIETGYEGGEVTPPVAVVGGTAHWNVSDIRGLAQSLSGQAPGEASQKLCDMLSAVYVPSLTNEVVATFRLCDARGDGTLGKDELQHFLQELYATIGLPTPPDDILRSEITSLYRKHDADRNQKISVKELGAYLATGFFASTVSQSRRRLLLKPDTS